MGGFNGAGSWRGCSAESMSHARRSQRDSSSRTGCVSRVRLLAGTSQAFCKRLRGRTFGAGVAPEFMPKRNSKLIGTRGRTAGDGRRLEIGEQRGS